MRINKTQKQNGFAIIETLLLLVLVAIIAGTGYFVWHSKSQADKSLNTASNTKQIAPITKKLTSKSQPKKLVNFQKDLVITEWNVMAPNDGDDEYSYILHTDYGGNIVSVVSKNLSDNYNCVDSGAGMISRLSANEVLEIANPKSLTAEQYSKENPGFFTAVGGYYYRFSHDQGQCSYTGYVKGQNQANDAVKALVAKLQPITQ
jgi:hypothetical protein